MFNKTRNMFFILVLVFVFPISFAFNSIPLVTKLGNDLTIQNECLYTFLFVINNVNDTKAFELLEMAYQMEIPVLSTTKTPKFRVSI